MKKFLLFIFIFFAAVQLQANAEITTEEQLSREYIINHGYSGEMARLMNLQHDQIVGVKPSLSDETHIYRPWQNGIRKLLMYIDPGLDDERFMQHDIKYTVRWDSI
ncbi:hypothetical protein IJ732_01225 [bacterium]|nr:hypothetical protein [bacterium]